MTPESSLHWCIHLVLVIFPVRTCVGSLVAKVVCNDQAVAIYIDGVNVGSTARHTEVWSGTVDETARVIAVDCENRWGGGAFLVSFSNGFISDERWKCSGTNISGWYDINFDDSGWKMAYVIRTNGVSTGWPGKIDDFADDAKWIWKDKDFAVAYRHSYCRAHIECGCEYKCDMTGDEPLCFCPAGYVLNGDNRTCADVNECIQTPCDQTCVNSPGSYECQCSEGYVFDDDRAHCKDTDECATGTHTCPELFKCDNVIGSYRCLCQSGYHEVHNSGDVECVDNDECNTQSPSNKLQFCEHTCNNTPGSYSCQCNPGYSLDADGHHCSDTDECATGTHDCMELECINTIGNYQCVCPDGFKAVVESDTINCLDDNECERLDDLCEQSCENTIGSYVCSCEDGSVLRDDGRACARKSGNSENPSWEEQEGSIASITIIVILVILLVLIGIVFIIIRRRRNVSKEGAGRRKSESQSGDLELVNNLGETKGQFPTKSNSGNDSAKTGNAAVAEYEEVEHRPGGPYESLGRDRADPCPYEQLP